MFYFFSLFFPRITILVAYLFSGIPANTTPFCLDVILAIFAPRLLIAYWLWSTGEWACAFLFILVSLFAGGTTSSAGTSYAVRRRYGRSYASGRR